MCSQLSGVDEPVEYEFLNENDPLVKRIRGLPLSTVHEICVSFQVANAMTGKIMSLVSY